MPRAEDANADLVAWIESRQHRLLRAAYLLTGDLHRAEDLLQEALVKLAGRWDRVRDGNPDASVRTIVYRARSVTVVAAGTALALGTGAAVMLSDVAPRGDRQPSEQAPLPSIATDPTDEADEAYADLLQNVAVADRWTPSRLEVLDWYTSAFPR